MSARIPLDNRPGLITQENSKLGSDLKKLALNNGFLGAVVIGFDRERVHVAPCGIGNAMSSEMQKLADRILAAIDDGFFDPEAPDQFPQGRTQ